MDNSNATYSIGITFTPPIVNTTSNFTWDNDTNGFVPIIFDKNKQQYFWIGMAFVGGLVAGFFLHCLYYCLCRYLHSEMDDEPYLPGGIVNLSYIGDESRAPVNDHPPDYATVVSGNSEGDNSSFQKEPQTFFRRLFKRSYSRQSEETAMEELPPSYSSVVPSLEDDLSVRWNSDDRIVIATLQCPTEQEQ